METNLKLTALSMDVLLRILQQAGSRTVTAETLVRDFETGAPKNPDGTVNLIAFAAWMFRAGGDDGD